MATETEAESKDDLPKIWKKEIPTLTAKYCFLIIKHWIRMFTINTLLGDDVLMLLSRFTGLKRAPYKSSFSPLFAGRYIKTFELHEYKPQITNELKQSKRYCTRASGYGVARMIDPLPHGTITEFTIDSIRPLVGVMGEISKCYELIPEKGCALSHVRFENDYPKLYGFYGMSCGFGMTQQGFGGNYNITSNQYGFLSCGGKIDRWGDFCPETRKKWAIGTGTERKAGYTGRLNDYNNPYPGGEVVVRVNLIDYLVSFWHKKSNNFIALMNKTRATSAPVSANRGFSYGPNGFTFSYGRTDVEYLNCPVVIELPHNPDANWYPAVFLTEVNRSTGCTFTRDDTEEILFTFETESADTDKEAKVTGIREDKIRHKVNKPNTQADSNGIMTGVKNPGKRKDNVKHNEIHVRQPCTDSLEKKHRKAVVIKDPLVALQALNIKSSGAEIFRVTLKLTEDQLIQEFVKRSKKYNRSEGKLGLARKLVDVLMQEFKNTNDQ
eukprot:361392_1